MSLKLIVRCAYRLCGTARCSPEPLFVRADGRAVTPGRDIHRVDPVVTIRAYFVADGRVGRLLMGLFKGFTNGSYLPGVVAVKHRIVIVDFCVLV